MKIFVDSSSYALENVGDAAMLHVAVARLRDLWPAAAVSVLSASPERLWQHCPGADAVPSNGLRKWLEWSRAPGRSWVPELIARRLESTDSRFRDHLPGFSDALALRRARNHPADLRDVEAFLLAADSADLLVLGGGGYVTDVFRGHALSSLELLSRFQRRGVPTVMVGQGIGPLRDAAIRSRAGAILPRVDLIALREGRAGLPLLESLGVARERILVTGDDAVGLAHAGRADRPGTRLGVNVRVSSYSSVGPGVLADMRTALARVAGELDTALLALPVSGAAADSDLESLRELVPEAAPAADGPRGLDTPAGLIRRVGECRVVLTGSYHAGVFALSQGIPVVALTRSDYYSDKFHGLADQFGSGCRVVDLDAPSPLEAVVTAVREMWRQADGLRPALLTSAVRQVEAGRAAYARLARLAGKPGSMLPRRAKATGTFG